jgi:PAS domain S-box-containing protein
MLRHLGNARKQLLGWISSWRRGRPLWIGQIGLTVALGLAYFFTAQLSLVLLTKPDGVAVFWPAAGISSGTLIALGSRARLPVTLGVFIASTVASLLGDRNLAAATVFALCNAGEPLLVAWLVQRHFGENFQLESLRSVVGFFMAAAAGPVVSGLVATVGFILFYSSAAPILTTWLNWFASDALGIIMVAPLLIGLASLRDNFPERWEVVQGTLTLVALVAVSAIAFGSTEHHLYTVFPLAVLLPILLAARCRPVFAAAAAVILGCAVVWTTTFGIGGLGEVPDLHDRAYAARATLLAISICTLVLAALFAERRQKEAALKDTNDRLELALDCAELGTWRRHLKSGRFENDVRDRHIHGCGSDEPPHGLATMRSQVHPEDLSRLDAAFSALRHPDDRCSTEYRLAPRTDQERGGRERWVAIAGAIVRRADGRPVQLLGVTRDITERKHAEMLLRASDRKSRELLGALPAAIYVTDAAGRITYCNQGAVDLWGMEPKLGEHRWCDLSRFYHLNGTPMSLDDCPTEIALKQGRVVQEREAILERLDGTRIPIVPFPTPLRDGTGAVVGVINMTVDITERRKAELALAERDAQLALAGRVALVGSYAYDVDTDRMRVSEGYAAIHGLPEGTTETTRSLWRTRAHPEDAEQVDARRRQAIRDRQVEYTVEYRIVLPERGVRWIESRSFIAYDSEGRPQRVVGINIDVTQRRRTEQALTDRNRQLALAGRAALVGSFALNMDPALEHTAQRMQVSSGLAAIFGYAAGTEEISVSDWRSRIHPDDLAQVLARRHQALAERRSEHHLEYRIVRPCGAIRWIESRTFIEYDQAGQASRLLGVNIDVTERKRVEEQKRVLLAELDHRVKNALATVTAVVSHTREGSTSVATFVAALEGRIRSMAATHELLSAHRWQGVSLRELVRREVAPFTASRNTEINGPDVILSPEAGQAMAIVLHELTTNAAKYGALSTKKGRVSIRWHQRLNGHPRSHLVLEWQEVGGPPVVAPGKSGYGTSTIRDLIPYEFGGTVDLVLAPEGVRCRLELAADWLRNGAEPVSDAGAHEPLRIRDT